MKLDRFQVMKIKNNNMIKPVKLRKVLWDSNTIISNKSNKKKKNLLKGINIGIILILMKNKKMIGFIKNIKNLFINKIK